MESITLEKLAKAIGGETLGEESFVINSIEDSSLCSNTGVCYLKDKQYLAKLSSNPGAVITTKELSEQVNQTDNFILVDDPYLAYAKTSQLFFESYDKKNNQLDSVLGKSIQIGKNTIINGNCMIGDNVILHDNVSIYSCTKIGDNSIIHSGSVIGSDGFGFAPDGDGWEKIAHLGGVEIGANVEVGANSVIDRGALGNTKIGDGVKMDNHIHIAHNVSIGENTAMAGMVGIAGSVKIGKNCKFGGQVGTVDHIEITDNVTVLAKTLVTKSLTEPGAYSGVMPIQKHKDSLKFAAKLKK
ncbi:MAG: UDP-3-O-(3-hydroxymyristoyl)glucosamine N-acyltransferase [Rickettsiales bacterium TMED289]|nr:UDP-3-O-(3-hydroxymyristoyl)glucosamine N-acyltransferase [Gammaproteobacteria bacterium]RPF74730.1 MAG: UDP-3-O-(3-hydroxymyristoyl)glucosamine N-acyltransferase [Rickettsiales bacterium TMED289]|tara:strand:- start:4802 stop:5698 length:897 start_codon:yes stop_codon:yes gene_type:complete